MSLGLPAHLAADAVADGIGRGARVVAAVCLFSAAVAQIILAVRHDTFEPLLVLAVVAALSVLLWTVERRQSLLAALVYVAGGGVGVAVATLVAVTGPANRDSGYPAGLLEVALVMVGGAGGGHRRGIALAVGGLVSGSLGAIVADAATGAPAAFPWMPCLAALLVVVIHVVTATSTRSARRAQPTIHRAARDERIADVRSGVEIRAAALLHDTVLGSLAALAATPTGPLPSRLLGSIEHDLAAIVGQDWTESREAPSSSSAHGPVQQAIAEERREGLGIDLTGDLSGLQRLDGQIAHTLALALRQLLANVREHSGSARAEVVVFGDDRSVSIMVIDSGAGFDPSAVPADRFGLRNSVTGRIESIGGSARVWSTVGRGTSVLVTVPASAGPASGPLEATLERTR